MIRISERRIECTNLTQPFCIELTQILPCNAANRLIGLNRHFKRSISGSCSFNMGRRVNLDESTTPEGAICAEGQTDQKQNQSRGTEQCFPHVEAERWRR